MASPGNSRQILILIFIVALIAWGTIQTSRLASEEKESSERIHNLQDSLRIAASIDSIHGVIENWDSLAMNSYATSILHLMDSQRAKANVGVVLQLDYRDSLLRTLRQMRSATK